MMRLQLKCDGNGYWVLALRHNISHLAYQHFSSYPCNVPCFLMWAILIFQNSLHPVMSLGVTVTNKSIIPTLKHNVFSLYIYFIHLSRKYIGGNVITFVVTSTKIECLHKIPLNSNSTQCTSLQIHLHQSKLWVPKSVYLDPLIYIS
jgi:hypothetical protein